MDALVLSRGKQECMALSPADKDACLVAAAQRQRIKFVALYDRYFSRIYRYVVQRVGVQQDRVPFYSLHLASHAAGSLGSGRRSGCYLFPA